MLKEDIQAISQIIQEGYLDGTFASITDWSVLNTTDPIVQYFTSKLGGIVRQCPRGTIAPPCNNIRHGHYAPSLTDHSGRWVISNGTTIALIGSGYTNQNYIVFNINSKPQLNDGIGQQVPVVCNVSDSPALLGASTIKPAQCGPWWPESHTVAYYSLTWEKLFS